MSASDVLETGLYTIAAKCPRCSAVEEIVVAIRSVLTTPEDGPASLKVALKGKARDHDCRQARIVTTEAGDVDTSTGEIK